jgi:uncharacterized membrane protein YjjP (DUF1212 family)
VHAEVYEVSVEKGRASMPWSRWMKREVDRLALDTEPPTMPGVFLDRGAYRPGPVRGDAQAHAYEVMELALGCGVQLLARGGAAVDVESAVHAAATTLGLHEVEVDVTFNSLWLSAVVDGYPVAKSRVVRQGKSDYHRLTQLHQLLTDIAAGDVDLWTAQRRLAAIEAGRRLYGTRVVLLSDGILAAAIAISLGAGWRVALVTGVTGFVIMWLGKRLSGPRVPEFFLAGLGGVIAVAVAAAMTSLKLDVQPSLVVAASIVVLLPSIELVGSVRDALVKFPLTATGRAVEGVVLMVGIVAGVLIALDIAAAANITMQIIPPGDSPTPMPLRILAAAIAAAAAAVAYQATWGQVGVSFVIGAVGFTVANVLLMDLPSRTTAFGVAAVAVGMAAGLAAQRSRSLALVFVVPGILPLLPGLVLYRGSLLLAAGETIAGFVVLLEVAVRMLALASGVLLGEMLVSRRRPR